MVGLGIKVGGLTMAVLGFWYWEGAFRAGKSASSSVISMSDRGANWLDVGMLLLLAGLF